MTEIRDKIREAQRRLWLNRWVAKLGWSLAGAAVAFIAFVVVERVLVMADYEGRLLLFVAAGLVGAAFVTSCIWMLVTRENAASAAARLDQAARLKERLSTALYYSESSDPFAQAAVADARQTCQLVTPKTYLPIQVPRSAPYAGGAFVVALLFCWLFPVLDLSGKQAARQAEQARQEQMHKAQDQVKPVVDKLRDLQAKHPELKKETQPADELEMAKLDAPADLRRDTLKQINAAAGKLNEQKNRPELAKVDDFKQMLRRLAAQPAPSSMVGELSKALAGGDFKAAKESLDSIRAELSKPATTPEEKAKSDEIRADLKKLADQVGKIADSNTKVKDQLQQLNLSEEDVNKLLEKLDKGDMKEFSKALEAKGLTKEQLDKLMKQAGKSSEAKKEASKLAQKLAKAAAERKSKEGDKASDERNQQAQGRQGQQGQAGKQSQSGQSGKDGQQPGGEQGESSGESLTEAGQQLSELESLQQEMADLNASLAQLDDMKDGMGQCDGGEGDPNRQGGGMGQLGQGMGGVAPKKETAFGTTPQRTRVHTASGAIIDQRFTEGKQYTGEMSSEFVEAVLGAREDVTETGRTKPVPQHIKLREAEFFQHVDADLPKDKVEAAQRKIEAERQAATAPAK
jgi:hypothetical protein